ncbi:unnamed protein product [Taenia asiatica]|uniref:Agrin n=1 Tax=Taenia asiatica TaxID=60517 RepID=A0A0R3VUR8_TAEAS|nr:unnamed protein product [Taenia asiatica]
MSGESLVADAVTKNVMLQRIDPSVPTMQACLRDQQLRILFDDNCAAGLNPCLEQGCPWPGEECRVDIQGRKTCVCPERCPAIVVPVCGSDGITYDSICHLLRTACLKKKHIWAVYAGQCVLPGNACERQGLYCRRYETCTQENNQRDRGMSLTYAAPSPKCSCPICPESGLGGKVCGSDGRTYRSECHLRAAACQSGHSELEIRQRGACGEVCGTDGRMYPSACELRRQACINKVTVKVDGSGLACRKPTFISNVSTSIDIQAEHGGEVLEASSQEKTGTYLCNSPRKAEIQSRTVNVAGCSCNPFGSITVSTCDSYSGQCKCKPGIRGQQCDICPDGELLTGEHCREPLSKMPDTKSSMRKAGGEVLVPGINFTPLATAFIPFAQSISPPFTFTLNFTPSPSVSDGDIALLVIPCANQVGQYSFLKLGISSGNLELSYVSKLGMGKIRYIMGKHRLESRPIKVSAEVTNNEDLSLYMANSTGSSVVEGASSRFIRSDEYGAMISNREATIIPEFNGKSFIRLAGPMGAESLKKRKMSLELIFLRKSDEGIIFAIPPSQTGSEFIVIRADTDECVKVYLRVGRIVQFSHSYFYNWLVERFGPRQRLAIAKICSVANDEWHKLSIEKASLYMTVRLDDQTSTELRLVVINGAELVLAGPSQNKADSLREPQLEHWEGTTQWQGPPCGENYSMCAKNSKSLKRICRPLGSSYKCSCSTPLTHMSILRHLTASLSEIDLLNNMTAQKEISARAEEMACDAIATRIRMASKDLQHDVPSKGNEIAISFSQDRRKGVDRIENITDRSGDRAVLYRNSVLLGGETVINYRGFVEKQ